MTTSKRPTSIPRSAEPWQSLHVPLDDLKLAPTDIARFISHDQCQRYLRLRLHQREHGEKFLREFGVVAETIPPMLRREGHAFEDDIEAEISRHFPTTNLEDDAPKGNRRDPDNGRVIESITNVKPGETIILSQARLAARLDGWYLRGDADLLKLQRDEHGRLGAFIADIKASRADRLEHHLQVAFYTLMLQQIFKEQGIEHQLVQTGVLFRGPVHTDNEMTPDEIQEMELQREAARDVFGLANGLLEVVTDRETYFEIAHDLVTSDESLARRIAATPFEDVDFHLERKCDGCIYNAYCMRWAAERDDLSLIPHLTTHDKSALRRNGPRTVAEIAAIPTSGETEGADPELLDLRRRLATTWPLAARLDEMIYRARSYRRSKGDPYDSPYFIPNKGYTSLPHTDTDHNPNLVVITIDIGHDYLHDRLYMLGARVVAHENGKPTRPQNIVEFTGEPPETGDIERDLIQRWTQQVITATVTMAAPDHEGESRAPIHLVFWNRRSQSQLLNGLARHFETVLGSTPLYDFITQRAAFDTGIASYLEEEIRDFRNYPLLCQSLQSVAIFRKFDWNRPEPFRKIFRSRMFDYIGNLNRDREAEPDWFYSRARYSSEIPLEYAYGAWDRLKEYHDASIDDPKSTYHLATPDLMRAFCARRLEAIDHIAGDFKGNRWTEKSSFDLPALESFEDSASTLAEALEEFILIERHVELAAWKAARLPAPQQRAANGDTLIVRYIDDDQDPETRILNSENRRKQALREKLLAELPDDGKLSTEQNRAVKWDHHGMIVKLQVESDDMDVDLDDLLGISDLREDSWIVIYPSWTVDGRLPEAEQVPLTPTSKQLLWGARGTIKRIISDRDESGTARSAFVEVEMRNWSANQGGFTFSDFQKRPFQNGETYTLESDPNNLTGARSYKVAQGLVDGGLNPLYERLDGRCPESATWPEAAQRGQRRFLEGLEVLREHGLHEFEASKKAFIGTHGAAPNLLVQGPPGTGKSYATAFAILARLQGALAADIDYRVLISCKTHAAINVVVDQILDVRSKLASYRLQHPDIFDAYFDERILTVPLCRIAPRGGVPEGVVALNGRNNNTGEDHVYKEIESRRRCILAGTPNAVYKMITDRYDAKRLFGHELIDCLIIDEASQIGLPEAMMAALPMKLDGQLIVVGDPRQMPPIIKHDWEREFRRTAKTFNIHESLFGALAGLDHTPPMVQFEQSFRLHTDMAGFLRESIYQADGIPYFSKLENLIKTGSYDDPFLEAALAPDYPLVVIVHDEEDSQKVNAFERDLIAPVLRTLSHPNLLGLDPGEGFGIVVPHRAQRAALQDVTRNLPTGDVTGSIDRLLAAVDTVERFQGGERDVIIVSATESDRQYLLTAGEFLYDPRRLTVALSRAKRKMILVASRSVFNTFVTDEDLFQNTLLWKRLLRRTCTIDLWSGERHGHQVKVWGNVRH